MHNQGKFRDEFINFRDDFCLVRDDFWGVVLFLIEKSGIPGLVTRRKLEVWAEFKAKKDAIKSATMPQISQIINACADW